MSAENITNYYDVQDCIDAECNLEPIKCRHCGVVGRTTFHQNVGDAYCADCGKWQLEKGDYNETH